MTKNERRIERLIELRRVLRNHARAEARAAAKGVQPQDIWGDPQVACKIGDKRVAWDMGNWRMPYDDPFGMPRFRCDTAACALGSAALDPWHNAQGLRFPKKDEWVPYYGGSTDGVEAGRRFYGITYGESEWLFIPAYYPVRRDVRPTDVIARVNSLIKHYRDGRDDDLYLAYLANDDLYPASEDCDGLQRDAQA